jgi:hypothetical protein
MKFAWLQAVWEKIQSEGKKKVAKGGEKGYN